VNFDALGGTIGTNMTWLILYLLGVGATYWYLKPRPEYLEERTGAAVCSVFWPFTIAAITIGTLLIVACNVCEKK
jgi:hypothetical protein